jgi:hypothetical protein
MNLPRMWQTSGLKETFLTNLHRCVARSEQAGRFCWPALTQFQFQCLVPLIPPSPPPHRPLIPPSSPPLLPFPPHAFLPFCPFLPNTIHILVPTHGCECATRKQRLHHYLCILPFALLLLHLCTSVLMLQSEPFREVQAISSL